MDFLKNKYGFDKNYLMKLKTDLDFLKDTEIGDLYQFSLKGKDPFLVNLSIEQNNNKFKVLPISEESNLTLMGLDKEGNIIEGEEQITLAHRQFEKIFYKLAKRARENSIDK